MLSVEHLSVDYERGGARVHAVQDVSLAVSAGEAVGLVGESGSGKSTVALAILRLIRPHEGRITAGRILFHGQDLLGLDERGMRQVRGNRIAMIFQDPFSSLNPVLRVRDQMAEVLRAHGRPPEAARLEAALAEVRLDAQRVLASYPHQLSGGQRQRVMISMALLGEPQLLLADEPTTALDVLVQKEILQLLEDLRQRRGLGLVLISHHLALVARHASRLLVMRAGRIVEEKPTRELIARPAEAYTRELLAAVPRMPPC